MAGTMLTSTFNQTSGHDWLLTRRLEAVQGAWSDLVKRVDSKPNSFRMSFKSSFHIPATRSCTGDQIDTSP
jgi:hypothetical protein